MSTDFKVVDITKHKKEVNEDLIEAANDLLELVKSGDVVDIAWIGTTATGSTGGAVFAENDPMRMIGEIRCLEQRILDHIRYINDGEI